MKPLELSEVIDEEMEYLKKRRTELEGEDPQMEIKEDLIGIASSGGGIRSAIINLGFFEVLAKYGVLQKSDYHSTVSGGGYAGAYLQGTLLSTGTYEGLFNAKNLENLRSGAKEYMAPNGFFSKLRLFQAYFTHLFFNLVNLLVIYKVITYVINIFGCFFHYNPNFEKSEKVTTLKSCALFFLTFVLFPFSLHVSYYIRNKIKSFEIGVIQVKLIFIYLVYVSVAILEVHVGFRIIEYHHSILFYEFLTVLFLILLLHFFAFLAKVDFIFSFDLELITILILASVFFLEGIELTYSITPEIASILKENILHLVFLLAIGIIVSPSQFSFGKYYETKLMNAFLRNAPYSQLRFTSLSDLITDGQPKDKGKSSAQKFFQNVILGIDLFIRHKSFKFEKPHLPPFPLINTCLNLSTPVWGEKQKGLVLGDYFLLSPLHIGSESTGYLHSSRDEFAEISLPVAMRISGAAINAGMGFYSTTFRGFFITLLNASLGQWIRNPKSSNFRYKLTWAPEYFLRDLISKRGLGKGLVNISDGGHIENLGVFELLRRKCKLIICIDASEDPNYTFYDLSNLMKRSMSELGLKIQFRSEQDPETIFKPNLNGHSISTFAIADVYEVENENSRGTLTDTTMHPLEDITLEKVCTFVYVKSSVTTTMTFEHKTQHIFPHHPTSNQFYSQEEWDNYFKMGQYLAINLLQKSEFNGVVSRRQIIDFFDNNAPDTYLSNCPIR